MVQTGSWERPEGRFVREVPAWSSSKDKASIIVAASRALYERNGIHATSVTQIAREIGITRELFYYYFSNKTEVVSRVVEEYAAEVLELWRERVGETGSEPDYTLQLIGVLREFLYVGEDNEPSPCVKVLFEAKKSVEFLAMVSAGVRDTTRQSLGRVSGADDAALDLVAEHGVTGLFALLEAHPDLDADQFVRGLEVYWRQWHRK